ncbi:MAG: SDR family NAD(P)-dependent oxidoreductase [Actinomycetes bacterium]|jgi:NAD(P)-dependent dehydrogenase (short-subunit alcohol dehydrogenase family)|nr:SDR family NAD(P)-dependent oxidoreductase [Actinomycetes bacterium]
MGIRKTDGQTMRVAIVTGASRGIGRACAEMLARRGIRVFGFSRTAAEGSPDVSNRTGREPAGGMSQPEHIACDVTDSDSVAAGVEAVLARAGRVDIVVCNAGFGIAGPVETAAEAEVQRQFDVNYGGVVRVITAVLPHLRVTQGSIVCVSSVAALLPVPYQAHYSASKAALCALVLALRNEVSAQGVRVSCVLPGDTRTGFTDARWRTGRGAGASGSAGAGAESGGGGGVGVDGGGGGGAHGERAGVGEAANNADAHYPRAEAAIAKMEQDERRGMSADVVARAVVRAALARHPRPMRVVGAPYRLFAVLARVLPTGVVNRLEGMLYG